MAEPEYIVSQKLKDVSDSLAPFRPPTAPANDIELEKRKIVRGGPTFLFLHATISMILLSVVCYLVLPVKYATPISALLLSVAVAVGIFLWK